MIELTLSAGDRGLVWVQAAHIRTMRAVPIGGTELHFSDGWLLNVAETPYEVLARIREVAQ